MQTEKQSRKQPTKHTSSPEAEQGKVITVKVTPKNAKGTGHTVTSEPTEEIDTFTISEKRKNKWRINSRTNPNRRL